jgi:hypothetical protein
MLCIIVSRANHTNLVTIYTIIIDGVMHNFLFSQSTPWWPNHESNRAQV